MAPHIVPGPDAEVMEGNGDVNPHKYELGFGDGTEEPPLQIAGPTEEWSAGIQHWIVIIVGAFVLWWLWSRFSGSDTTAGRGSSGSLGGSKSQARPDAEELRRKRLEALQKSSSASDSAPEASVSTEATPVASSGDGPRRRNVAPVAASSDNAGSASSKPELSGKDVQPSQSKTASVVETVDQAPSNVVTNMVANGPKDETAPTEAAIMTTVTEPDATSSGSLRAESPKPESIGAAPEELTAATESSAEASGAGKTISTPISLDSTVEAATTGTPHEHAVRVRGTLNGATIIKTVGGLTPSTSMEKFHDLVRLAFGPGAQDCRLRLVFNGKELKNSDVQISSAGITVDSLIQAMFLSDGTNTATASDPPAATTEVNTATASNRPVAATASSPVVVTPEVLPGTARIDSSAATTGSAVTLNSGLGDATAMVPFAIRVNGTYRGSVVVHMIEDLVASTSVQDLQRRVIAAYEASAEMQLRLFYMGKELKDPNTPLSTVGLKPGVTVIATFAAAKPAAQPIGTPVAGQTSDTTSPNPGTQGISSVMPSLATADAATSEPVSISPEEAWRAMAGLEEQLARIDDTSESPPVKQAAAVLRQMLVTVTHDNNPALLQLIQTMVPDLHKIWNYEPTRDHLKGLLQPHVGDTSGGTNAGGSSSADESAAASNNAA